MGVLVVREEPARHLRLEGDEVVFDCIELYAHFRRSIEEHARPYIFDHADDAQRRLDALLQHRPGKGPQPHREIGRRAISPRARTDHDGHDTLVDRGRPFTGDAAPRPRANGRRPELTAPGAAQWDAAVPA